MGSEKNVFNIVETNGRILQGEEGPDYYVRCGNKVFIIEFKDAIFAAGPKHSYDIVAIKEELKIKLKENKKGRRKGVAQLAHHANLIAKEGLEIDEVDLKNFKLYPILITTDMSFNSFGVNYLLNSEYKDLLTLEANSHSCDLVIIHIDTLIEFQDIFHDKKIPVQKCFDLFYNYTTKPISNFDCFLSFSDFMPGELNRLRIDVSSIPRKLNREIPTLFLK